MQKQSNKFMIGAIVGGTIGAMTSLLFGTSEGKKIQKRLMKKYQEMNQKSGHFGMDKLMHGKKKHSLLKAKRKTKRKLKRTR